jgi:hypothetical protein
MEQFVFGVYGPAVTLVAIFIARRIILSRGLLRDAPSLVKVAAACLVIGVIPLSLSFWLAFGELAFLCFDYCPPDVAGAIQRILLTNLTLNVLCFAGWGLALYALARERQWRAFTLTLLSLPVVVVASALMLWASSAHGEIVPLAQDAGWLYALYYAVLPIALCWPLATILALGMTREQVVRLPSVWRWLAPGR